MTVALPAYNFWSDIWQKGPPPTSDTNSENVAGLEETEAQQAHLRYTTLSDVHPRLTISDGSSVAASKVLLLPKGYWAGSAPADRWSARRFLAHILPAKNYHVALATTYPFLLSVVIGLLGGIRRDTPTECATVLFSVAGMVVLLVIILALIRPFLVPATLLQTLVVHLLFALQLVVAGLYLRAPSVTLALTFSLASCLESILVLAASAHAYWLREESLIAVDVLCRQDEGRALIVPSSAWDLRGRGCADEAPDDIDAIPEQEEEEDEDEEVLRARSCGSDARFSRHVESLEETNRVFRELADMRHAAAAGIRQMAVVASIRPPSLSCHERRVRLAALVSVACDQGAVDSRIRGMASCIDEES
jgi:hypothetical protein